MGTVETVSCLIRKPLVQCLFDGSPKLSESTPSFIARLSLGIHLLRYGTFAVSYVSVNTKDESLMLADTAVIECIQHTFYQFAVNCYLAFGILFG